MTHWVSIPLGVLGGLCTGVFVGFINGLLISRWKITPFIATLGMLGVCTGLTFIVSNGTSVTNLPDELGTVATMSLSDLLAFPY